MGTAWAQTPESDTGRNRGFQPKASDSLANRQNRTEGSDTIMAYQLRKLKEYSTQLNGIANFLSRGVDTFGISEKLVALENKHQIARTGILDGTAQRSNMRNMKSALVLMENLQCEVGKIQEDIEAYSVSTYDLQKQLRVIWRDTMLRKVPEDSILAKEYALRITEVREMSRPSYRQLQTLSVKLGIYQNQIGQLEFDVSDDIEMLKYQLSKFRSLLMAKEAPNLFSSLAIQEDVVIPDWFENSITKSVFSFVTYYKQTWLARIGIFLLVIAFLSAGIWAVKTLKKNDQDDVLHVAGKFSRHIVLSSIFIALSFGQFFYEDAPAEFIQYVWASIAIIGTLIYYRDFERKNLMLWLAGLALFMLASLDNLLLQTTLADRWIMLALGFSGLFLSIVAMRRLKGTSPDTMPLVQLLLILFMAQEVIGIGANIFGRYTFAKIMLTGGYFNFINAITLWWLLRLLTDFIFILSEAIRQKEYLTSYFNFQKIKESTKPILSFIMVILWLIIFVKNLSLYDIIKDGIEEFLLSPRSIGSFHFSFGSVLLFFLIIYLATLLSSIINYFMGSGHQTLQSKGRNRFGGFVLIMRLCILAIGFLVAVAAAGVALDKITLIIGALGVGIGFGLQNIVNNLVSGVIIAFEKPIHVGDQIEVGGRLGRVTAIGIRSSKLATFEGSEVIIPNGDLLSQHLVNWTLSSNNRRVEIVVGVKYGSDLETASKILMEVLVSKENIMRVPPPQVLLHAFGGSSIDYRLLFWVSDIGDYLGLKSEVIHDVDKAFKENGIEIPFPQQDVYIKELPVFKPAAIPEIQPKPD